MLDIVMSLIVFWAYYKVIHGCKITTFFSYTQIKNAIYLHISKKKRIFAPKFGSRGVGE